MTVQNTTITVSASSLHKSNGKQEVENQIKKKVNEIGQQCKTGNCPPSNFVKRSILLDHHFSVIESATTLIKEFNAVIAAWNPKHLTIKDLEELDNLNNLLNREFTANTLTDRPDMVVEQMLKSFQKAEQIESIIVSELLKFFIANLYASPVVANMKALKEASASNIKILHLIEMVEKILNFDPEILTGKFGNCIVSESKPEETRLVDRLINYALWEYDREKRCIGLKFCFQNGADPKQICEELLLYRLAQNNEEWRKKAFEDLIAAGFRLVSPLLLCYIEVKNTFFLPLRATLDSISAFHSLNQISTEEIPSLEKILEKSEAVKKANEGFIWDYNLKEGVSKLRQILNEKKAEKAHLTQRSPSKTPQDEKETRLSSKEEMEHLIRLNVEDVVRTLTWYRPTSTVQKRELLGSKFEVIESALATINEFEKAVSACNPHCLKSLTRVAELHRLLDCPVTVYKSIGQSNAAIPEMMRSLQEVEQVEITIVSDLLQYFSREKLDVKKALEDLKNATTNPKVLNLIQTTENLWDIKTRIAESKPDYLLKFGALVSENSNYMKLMPYVMNKYEVFPYQFVADLIRLPMKQKNASKLKGETLYHLVLNYSFSLTTLLETTGLTREEFCAEVDLDVKFRDVRLVDSLIEKSLRSYTKKTKHNFLMELKIYFQKGADPKSIYNHLQGYYFHKDVDWLFEVMSALDAAGFLLAPSFFKEEVVARLHNDLNIELAVNSAIILHLLNQITTYEIPGLKKLLAIAKGTKSREFLEPTKMPEKLEILEKIVSHPQFVKSISKTV